MANYSVNITDNGGDVWTATVLRGPSTVASGGTSETIRGGASNLPDIHMLLHRVGETIKNSISANGHN